MLGERVVQVSEECIITECLFFTDFRLCL